MAARVIDELRDFGFDGDKPVRPKEALRSVLRATRKQPSSALFRSLSERVGFARCSDASFAKFQSCLSSWFAV